MLHNNAIYCTFARALTTGVLQGVKELTVQPRRATYVSVMCGLVGDSTPDSTPLQAVTDDDVFDLTICTIPVLIMGCRLPGHSGPIVAMIRSRVLA